MSRKLHASASLLLCVLLSAYAFSQQRPELNGNPGTIPSGTVLNVRVIDTLSSETSQVGDVFHGTLQDDVEANGKVIFPRGADVTGRVTTVTPSGRLSSSGMLELTLTSINANNVAAKMVTEPLKIQGESHTKSNTTKIGAGAAAGAIIGAIAGGGKGAAIGTIAGGAAGTGAAAATGKREAKVEPEAMLSFTTSVNVLATAVTPGSKQDTSDLAHIYSDDPQLKVRRPDGTTTTADATPPQQVTNSTATNSTATTATQPSAPASAPVAAQPSATSGSPTPATAPAPTTAPSPASGATEPEFTARDRRVLRTCLTGDTGEMPSGLAQKEPLPPGSDQQIRKNGVLSPAVAKRAQALPLACESQLPKLPSNVERVVLNHQVLLLDSQSRVLDLFNLDQ